jgi:hypothetical protein
MRKLVWAAAVVIVIGLGWWGLAMWSLSSGLQGWLAERRAEGWQAETRDLERSGFPEQIRADLIGLALADPETGLALEAERLGISARTLWPGDVALILPQSPLRLATPTGMVDLGFDTGRADLNLHPGTALELRNLSFTSGPVQASNPEGGLFSASSTELRMAQAASPETYDITLELGQFTPGAVPRRALLVPQSWPLVFTALEARATVAFDRPWDRRAIEEARPQPRQITLHAAEAHWGDVRLRLTGTLEMDPQGVPTGEVVLRAENWQAMLDLAERAGLLPPDLRGTVQNVLTSLAAGSGRTSDIDVTLRFDRGLVLVGFLPLGPAPTLRLP